MRDPIKNYFDNHKVFIVVLILICIVFSFIFIIYKLHLQLNELRLNVEFLLKTQELLLRTQEALVLHINEKEILIQKLTSVINEEVSTQTLIEKNKIVPYNINSPFNIFIRVICATVMLTIQIAIFADLD